MGYLKGEHLDKNELKIGQRIIYLEKKDIDKSGRGYFFPRTGTVTSLIKKREIELDERTIISINAIQECVLATEENIKLNPFW